MQRSRPSVSVYLHWSVDIYVNKSTLNAFFHAFCFHMSSSFYLLCINLHSPREIESKKCISYPAPKSLCFQLTVPPPPTTLLPPPPNHTHTHLYPVEGFSFYLFCCCGFLLYYVRFHRDWDFSVFLCHIFCFQQWFVKVNVILV